MPIFLLLLAFSGCRSATDTQGGREMTLAAPASSLTLQSSALVDGKRMPVRYTADGQDLSPPLAWSGVPPKTQSFALICDDPDAPNPKKPNPDPWVHWVLYNIPADIAELPEGLPRGEQLDALPDARQGSNSWPSDNLGYRGPAPPHGSGTHRYVFQLYALDTVLTLPATPATKTALLTAMKGHLLGEARLTVVYDR
jgi:Raf kinase inhibitor-like YbhB/YbcL family protein